ncbi:MAG: bile acid:sodium symporter [Novosphingobium sp.]|nr:bile acid:sodium symporter [Novosphingobium sp.]
MRRIYARIDPFVAMLLATVAAASILPCSGVGATIFGWLADAAIVLLFFLQGARLSREAITDGLLSWKIHASVLACSFLLYPALGYGLVHLLPLDAVAATGFLFLTLLPSTVQSSVALTAIARGNVAAAVCSASLSNIVGIFATPLLVSLVLRRAGAASDMSAVPMILLQLLLPFLLGHFSPEALKRSLLRHKPLTTLVDRSSILLVVYTAFSAAVIAGIWHSYSLPRLAEITLLCAALLALVLVLTWNFARRAGFSFADSIVIQFCGSKKSLVTGVPMAGVLFAPAQVGFVVLPLMIFHQMQLIACAFLARRYAAREEGGQA